MISRDEHNTFSVSGNQPVCQFVQKINGFAVLLGQSYVEIGRSRRYSLDHITADYDDVR